MITVSGLRIQFGKRVLFQDVNMKFTAGKLLRSYWSKRCRKINFPEGHFRGTGRYGRSYLAWAGRKIIGFKSGSLCL